METHSLLFSISRLIGDRRFDERTLAIKTGREMEKWVRAVNRAKGRLSFGIVVADDYYDRFSPTIANRFRKLAGLQ